MKVQINLKIEASQKKRFLEAAHSAQEDLMEFLVNSAMLRIERRMLEDKPTPPFASVGKLYLDGYRPSQVTEQDARAIEVQLEKARKGRLKFEKMGSIPVAVPERAKRVRAPKAA